jgi:hypothetical protein
MMIYHIIQGVLFLMILAGYLLHRASERNLMLLVLLAYLLVILLQKQPGAFLSYRSSTVEGGRIP